MRGRKAVFERKTKETSVSVRLNLDGKGKYRVDTGIPFLDHMLSVFAKHAKFDLELTAKGDLQVDEHHTVEDVGISLGRCLLKALEIKKTFRRFGSAHTPMDEALAHVAIDLSGRAFLSFNVEFKRRKGDKFDTGLVEEFMRAFSNQSKMNLHIRLLYGKNNHHIIEAIFKALALSLEHATRIDPRVEGIPSTKGSLC